MGVASSWALTATEALRLLGQSLSSEAKRLERLNGVLNAHRSFLLIAPEPRRYVELLRRSDPVFDGASMLNVMLRDDLAGVVRERAYLLAHVVR